MDPVVSLQNAVVRVGPFPVLAGVDLVVERGERVLVQGPNGAGKTSLLRTIAGLLAITSGSATVLGHDLTIDRRSVRPSIGYLAHSTGLYDDLTAADNVRFWASATRTEHADAEAAMRTVGLNTRLWDVPVRRLSTGQRRRVSLAAMVVRRPQLWLLDEPHAGLDVDGRDVVDDLIGAAAQAGATVLFASHDLDRAVEVSSRIVTIVGGVVSADVS